MTRIVPLLRTMPPTALFGLVVILAYLVTALCAPLLLSECMEMPNAC